MWARVTALLVVQGNDDPFRQDRIELSAVLLSCECLVGVIDAGVLSAYFPLGTGLFCDTVVKSLSAPY